MNRVTADVLVDKERGFRRRITGKIKWHGTINDIDLILLENISVYVYHPDNFDNGRYIPSSKEYLCEASEVLGDE